MLGSRKTQRWRSEMLSMANQLPYPRIACREFSQRGYEPPAIRQPRSFSKPASCSHIIGRFLQERGTVELLKPDQTVALFKEIHWCVHRIRALSRRRHTSVAPWKDSLREARLLMSRIEAAEEELYIANRRLIVKCARHYFWLDPFVLADFLQEGARTMANAVRCFDFTRGTPFIAYAQRAVQNRLRNCVRDYLRAGMITLQPSREMETVSQAIDTWQTEHGNKPDNPTLARITGLSEMRVHKTRNYLNTMKHAPVAMVSLDALIHENSQADLYDFIQDTRSENALESAAKAEIWKLVDRLPARDRQIIRLRFMEGHTLEETGRMLHLTRARIKQLQDRALWSLRQMLSDAVLKSVA